MNDIITEILDLTDDDSKVTKFKTIGMVQKITIEKNKRAKFCPVCGARLHSKGKFIRHPNQQVLQDGYLLEINAIGRRWECSNKDCKYTCTDQFGFVEPNKKNTKMTEIRIIAELKDLHKTCRQVAQEFNVSDTYVHQVFMRYVDLPRLPLPEVLSVDEVYVNLAKDYKYAMVLMDFVTGDVIDVLESRRDKITRSYFNRIPKEERDNVKFLICDMYKPYINYTATFFRNAKPITDSFHVIQWLLNLINRYINTVRKKYRDRDYKALEEKNYQNNASHKTTHTSEEVYLLNNARWVLLKNEHNINYDYSRHYNSFLDEYLDTYDWQKKFMSLDLNFPEIKRLKDKYEEFNERHQNDLEGAAEELDELIEEYSKSSISVFREFSQLLKTYRTSIINSFTYISVEETEDHQAQLRRLSNGPMESYNRNPSDFRSRSNGLSNFSYIRNRLLWSARKDASIRLVPKTVKEVTVHTGKTRGSYKKHN